MNLYVRLSYRKNKSDTVYELIKTYEVASFREDWTSNASKETGKYQKAFIASTDLIHTSNYYLSLGINYPNKSDKILGSKEKVVRRHLYTWLMCNHWLSANYR